MRVPFNKMSPVGQEFKYIQQAVLDGQSSEGRPFSKGCEDYLLSLVGGKSAIMTTSATASLEMATILLNFIEDLQAVITC